MTGAPQLTKLAHSIKQWGRELGFQEVGIADTTLTHEEALLQNWLEKGFHGEMDYMARHGTARSRPSELVPGTMRVISVRLNYFPEGARDGWEILDDPEAGYISRYALGRDYHKVMRGRLQQLATRIETSGLPEAADFRYRVFADSAPVMEVALARKAGLGWRGKHTLLLTRDAGSLFFLGEIYTNLPLPPDEAVSEHCGSCTKCIDVCPTGAIVAPYSVDARRCISYLTIELGGAIPVELRPKLGNRIYGCDDCQLACPWNKYAVPAAVDDFEIRNGLDHARLVDLFAWTEQEFNRRLEGSAIRRIGHERWLRNIAVALGNALSAIALDPAARNTIVGALRARRETATSLVREHLDWALAQA